VYLTSKKEKMVKEVKDVTNQDILAVFRPGRGMRVKEVAEKLGLKCADESSILPALGARMKALSELENAPVRGVDGKIREGYQLVVTTSEEAGGERILLFTRVQDSN
jgi:hypothetical protein